MRILYAALDPVPFPKGSAVRIEASVRALVKAGAQVRLLTPRAERVAGFAERLELEGLEHRPVELGDDNFLDRALTFRRLVARELADGFDLAWVRSPWEGLAGSVPLVYEAHGFPSVELPDHFPRLREHPELWSRLIDEELRLLAAARLLVTPSQVGARYLHSRGVPPARVRVVPNSLADEDFRTPAKPAEGPLRLLYLGTLAPWQGLGTLLEALALLKGRLPLVLCLAGTRKGPWVRELRRLSQRLRVRSLVEILGPQDRASLAELLLRSDVCLAPLGDTPRNALQGCCPIKILEYMGAGRPILSTRLACVEELVGDAAHLVRPSSAMALADGLRWFDEHRAEAAEMGRRAQERARHFRREAFEAQLAGLLEELRV